MIKDRLTELSSSLLKLHKVLLDQERVRYEAENGAVENPFKVLGLVMNDPFFAWLRPLSAFLVKVDELIADENPEPDATALFHEGEALLGRSGELSTRISELLQNDIDVAVLYGAVRQNLRQIAPIN